MTKATVSLVCAGIAAAVLLGAPLATGMLVETRVVERLSSIRERPLLLTELRSYERGWFTSRVEMTLALSADATEMAGAAADLLQVQIPVIVEITHGPIAFADGLHVGLTRVVAHDDPDGQIARFATERLSMPYLFEFRGQARIGNRFVFDGDVPPFDYAGELGNVTFSGLAVDGAQDDNRLRIAAAYDELSYRNPLASAATEGIAFDGEFVFRPDDWPLSNVRLAIGRVFAESLLLSATPILDAAGVELAAAVALDAEQDDLELTAALAADSAAWEEIAVTETQVAFTVTDIDAEAAQAYYTISTAAIDNPALDRDAVEAELAAAGNRILAAGPRLALEPIAFSMPQGRFEGNLAVGITADTASDPPPDLRNLAVLLSSITASADASISKALALRVAALWAQARLARDGDANGEIPGPGELEALAEAEADFTLAGLVGQGVLIDDGERLTTSLRYAPGSATVNGTPLFELELF